MPELAVLYDPQTGHWQRFSNPLAQVEVHDRDQVLDALDHIERRVEEESLFAAGFVSYEAASAFDNALQTHPAQGFPLLHFCLFSRREIIDLPAPAGITVLPTWRTDVTCADFSAKVDSIREAIARGESYQVNLTFPLTGEFHQDPWLFFLQLVHYQQAKGAGYLQTERWALCSASPELFFSRDNEHLQMRPMKGTAARGRTLAEDNLQAKTLQESPKNRAENIMILDMVRNDLGRIAVQGEVTTEEICTLEKYPTLWQLTSTVSARSKASLREIFQALFPCASITGAPKVRTMQIITATEATPRQAYTGTFGWIAPGRQAHFSVAIRTALIDQKLKLASYGIGAGITWDSNSADEYQECLDKAAVLSRQQADFALIETLRWAPGKGYFVLQQHLQRLRDSAEYFDFVLRMEEIQAYLLNLAEGFPKTAQRVRLLLHRSGRLESTVTTIETRQLSPARIQLAKTAVNSADVFLYHKTTQRRLYEEQRAAAAADVDEVVLYNERGEVTECCTANLVVEIAGALLTPPLDSGLLPGTYRSFLLERGIIAEQLLTPEDLHHADRIFLINAVRKWRQAVFCVA